VLTVLSILAAASLQIKAQTFVTVNVHIPYTVEAGTSELPPGDYVIRRVANIPSLFAFYKDGGMALETFVWAIPAQKINPPSNTELTLRNDGHEYILDQLWVDGGMGYQFQPPPSSKSSEHGR
jgi:hypothetical protein